MTANHIDDRSILITGATGSFGNRFIATLLARHRPKRVVVYSRDELKQFDMQQNPALSSPAMRYFIGDVRDLDRLQMAMRGIDVVIHAAALKQVPTAEYNPFECIRTNVHGAENVVRAAIATNVKRVVALSTDKASNPINLYGASKLASDKIFVAGNNLAGADGPRFCVVRYGNVVGSRGSVVPFFQRLLREGATSLPVTDPRMTRFWITLDHGVSFVLSSLEMMRGGETFIPKIPSMRVVDLVEAMAPGIATHVVGIRPGEKLHEAMFSEDDSRGTVELPDRYVIEPAFPFWTGEHLSAAGATPVSEGFFYRSDTNTEWLDAPALRRLLEVAA
jgi:UDP-N-acetylglucosamine 4,6-dehydratase/5-epimerase